MHPVYRIMRWKDGAAMVSSTFERLASAKNHYVRAIDCDRWIDCVEDSDDGPMARVELAPSTIDAILYKTPSRVALRGSLGDAGFTDQVDDWIDRQPK